MRELVRNAVDAGARNVYVATSLHSRRYRELIVLDDGSGVSEPYRERIFEPGVTTRHLTPSRTDGDTHGAGLSLYHLKESALSAEVLSLREPTSVRAVFDTENLPERDLQSASRASRTNLLATLRTFAEKPSAPDIYYGSPASMIALLINSRIIHYSSTAELERWCQQQMGAGLTRRTLQRILKGKVALAERVEAGVGGVIPGAEGESGSAERFVAVGGKLHLEERDLAEIRAVIERAANESYLRVGDLNFSTREGEIILKAQVYEAEEEYDE